VSKVFGINFGSSEVSVQSQLESAPKPHIARI